jgi:DnaJ-domain-containing protein 1
MNLPGQLRSTTLGDLLGRLHRAETSGILELVETHGAAAGCSHKIFLDAGLIDGVETPRSVPLLGELLRRDGLLPAQAASRLARRLIERPRKRVGEILVDERLVSEEAVRWGLRRQLRLRLDSVFQLSDARVQFHVRRPRPLGAAPAPALGPSDFLYDRPRARGPANAASSSSDSQSAAYGVLGLAPSADARAVRAAFRRLAAEVHPDRHPHARPEERARMLRRFAELSAAYHVLVRGSV